MKRIARHFSFQTIIMKLLIKSYRLQKFAYRVKKEKKKKEEEERIGGKSTLGFVLSALLVCLC